MNEAVRQKHQLEMLRLDRIPNEDRGSSDVNTGSARVSSMIPNAFNSEALYSFHMSFPFRRTMQ